MQQVIRSIDILASPDAVWRWLASQDALRQWMHARQPYSRWI